MESIQRGKEQEGKCDDLVTMFNVMLNEEEAKTKTARLARAPRDRFSMHDDGLGRGARAGMEKGVRNGTPYPSCWMTASDLTFNLSASQRPVQAAIESRSGSTGRFVFASLRG